MTETNFRARCEELMDEAIYLGVIPYNQAPNPELIARARAALAQPEPVVPTDEELMAAARKAVDTYSRVSELPYFLNEDSCEYEPMLLALRAVARWSMPTNNIWRED